jgi:hypothetical protein
VFLDVQPGTGEIGAHVSLLCAGTLLSGPGVIYRVRFRVLDSPGLTSIGLGSPTAFYRAGYFITATLPAPIQVTVGAVAGVIATSLSTGAWLATPVPNPARSGAVAVLAFTLPKAASVGFSIVDVQGRRVAVREPQTFGSGTHSIAWDGLRMAAGRYFVTMSSGGSTTARAWVILR